MTQSNIKVHQHQIITTEPVYGQGETRWWGVCAHCGDVEEMSYARAEEFQRGGTCECCTEMLAQEQNEARWYRAGPF